MALKKVYEDWENHVSVSSFAKIDHSLQSWNRSTPLYSSANNSYHTNIKYNSFKAHVPDNVPIWSKLPMHFPRTAYKSTHLYASSHRCPSCGYSILHSYTVLHNSFCHLKLSPALILLLSQNVSDETCVLSNSTYDGENMLYAEELYRYQGHLGFCVRHIFL